MLTIKIETDNAAFDGDALAELCRMIETLPKALARNWDSEGVDFPLFDVNGNRCGCVEFAAPETAETWGAGPSFPAYLSEGLANVIATAKETGDDIDQQTADLAGDHYAELLAWKKLGQALPYSPEEWAEICEVELGVDVTAGEG